MNPSLKSRFALLGQGGTLAVAAVFAACSSSSTGTTGPGDNTGSAATPTIVGTGAACPTQMAEGTLYIATKVVVPVSWPETIAVLASTGGETLSIWLLGTYTVTGQDIKGVIKTCGNATPPIVLGPNGAAAEGAPMGSVAKIQVAIPTTVWDAPGFPVTPVTGTLGGFNVESSFLINPTVTLDGLSHTSAYLNPATTWPPKESLFAATDLTDDDGDGRPGISATPSSADGFYLPGTSLVTGAPKADHLDLALRTEVTFYGKSTSCTESSGAATVALLNNRVVGCSVMGTNCTPDQVTFIDANTTQYKSTGPGTYKSVELTQGATATCDDVLRALP